MPSIKEVDMSWNRLTDTRYVDLPASDHLLISIAMCSLQDGVLRLIQESEVTLLNLFGNDTTPVGRSMCKRAVQERNRLTNMSGRDNITIKFL